MLLSSEADDDVDEKPFNLDGSLSKISQAIELFVNEELLQQLVAVLDTMSENDGMPAALKAVLVDAWTKSNTSGQIAHSICTRNLAKQFLEKVSELYSFDFPADPNKAVEDFCAFVSKSSGDKSFVRVALSCRSLARQLQRQGVLAVTVGDRCHQVQAYALARDGVGQILTWEDIEQLPTTMTSKIKIAHKADALLD